MILSGTIPEGHVIKYFIHYTVNAHGTTLTAKRDALRVGGQHCVAGPYSEAEVLDQRRDIATYMGVSNVYISDKNTRAE